MASFEGKITKRIRQLENEVTQLRGLQEEVRPLLKNIPIIMTLFDEPILVDYALLKMQGKDVRVQLIEGEGNIIATAATDKSEASSSEVKVQIG